MYCRLNRSLPSVSKYCTRWLSSNYIMKVKHIGMFYWSPLVVQLLYAGFVSYPCWPLCGCQCECLLTSLCACILIDKPKALPALISQCRQQREDIDLSNPIRRAHSERADYCCRQWRMLLYHYITVITQNEATNLDYSLICFS